jgi:hypothetical protein
VYSRPSQLFINKILYIRVQCKQGRAGGVGVGGGGGGGGHFAWWPQGGSAGFFYKKKIKCMFGVYDQCRYRQDSDGGEEAQNKCVRCMQWWCCGCGTRIPSNLGGILSGPREVNSAFYYEFGLYCLS